MTTPSGFFPGTTPDHAPQHDNTTPTAASKIDHIVKVAQVRCGDSILDVGTGTGVMLPALARATGMFGSIDAIDISGDMLAQAHEKHARLPLAVRFMLANVETDTISAQYDTIVLYNVLPNLERPLETILRLYFNNLTGGGSLTIAHPTGREMVNALHRKNGVPHHELPTASALASRLHDLGVRVDYVEDSPEFYVMRLHR